MGWEFSDVVKIDLGTLFQGQTRIAKLKSLYNSLIIAHRVWDITPTYTFPNFGHHLEFWRKGKMSCTWKTTTDKSNFRQILDTLGAKDYSFWTSEKFKNFKFWLLS